MKSRISLNISFGAAAVVASTLVWIACGSSSPTTSGSEDGGGPSGSSSGTNSGSSSGGATGSSSGSVGSSSGVASGSSSGAASGSSGGSSGGITDGGTSCPQVACPAGQQCCADLVNQTTACSASCAPADEVACTRTSDCAGKAAADAGMCCATAILNIGPDGGNTFPRGCTVESITSYCGSCVNAPLALGDPLDTCQTKGDASVEYVHVCSATSDCANEPTNNLCCPVFSYNICLSTGLALIGNVTCMK